jgi:hypothetical protein
MDAKDGSFQPSKRTIIAHPHPTAQGKYFYHNRGYPPVAYLWGEALAGSKSKCLSHIAINQQVDHNDDGKEAATENAKDNLHNGLDEQ